MAAIKCQNCKRFNSLSNTHCAFCGTKLHGTEQNKFHLRLPNPKQPSEPLPPKPLSEPQIPKSHSKPTGSTVATSQYYSENNQVSIVDFNMPFGSMIIFLVKLALAAIPALIILGFIFSLLWAIFGVLLLSGFDQLFN